MSENFYAVIPAYEPDEHFPELVHRILDAGLTPIVVDDGSSSEYRDLFSRVEGEAKVLTHEKNYGKGHALKTAFTYIRDCCLEDAVIVTMDCDGQHTPEDALRICREAVQNPGALILGSRRQSASSPLRSRLGNGITRLVFRLSSGVRVYDTQTGLRAFSASLLPKMLSISGDRYEYEMNMLMECARSRISMIEVPIETIYIDNNSGSHFNAFKDSIRIYIEILKFSFSSFTGFLTDYILYTLLCLATAGMPGSSGLVLSNITARVVSAGVNFTLNRIFVFHSKDHVFKSAVHYFLLAACILAGNTLLLRFLVYVLGWNRYAAKILTEITFFTLSYIVQHFIIFRKKEGSEQ